MNEKDWELLKTLYEKKSISKASQTLFISQPALSTRLQQIEERFNTQIVVRCKKGVQFTPEGEYLVKASDEILKKIQKCEQEIQNMRDFPVGTLRIGASHYFTKHILPDLLKRFREQYPCIEFNVITSWSKEIVTLTQNYDVHIGFVRGDYSWPGEKQVLFEERTYISSSNPFLLENLPNIPRINYHNDSSTQLLLDKWWYERFSVPPYIGMEVDKVDTCKEMVARGLGYAFLPETIFSIDEKEQLYNYEMVFKSGKPMLRKTWMFYHKEITDLKLVKSFLDFIQGVNFITNTVTNIHQEL